MNTTCKTLDDYAGNSVVAIKYNYNPETDRFYVGSASTLSMRSIMCWMLFSARVNIPPKESG
jgi:hypothetical protein